jgi:outer membrane lipoprotein SlyB
MEMGRNGLLFAAVAAFLVAGCATPDSNSTSASAAAAKDDKTYRTGSHLPSKEPVANTSNNPNAKSDIQSDRIRAGQGPVPSN